MMCGFGFLVAQAFLWFSGEGYFKICLLLGARSPVVLLDLPYVAVKWCFFLVLIRLSGFGAILCENVLTFSYIWDLQPVRPRGEPVRPCATDNQAIGFWYLRLEFCQEHWKEKQWNGPFQVLLNTYTAIKIIEQATWIPHGYCKKVPDPGSDSLGPQPVHSDPQACVTPAGGVHTMLLCCHPFLTELVISTRKINI